MTQRRESFAEVKTPSPSVGPSPTVTPHVIPALTDLHRMIREIEESDDLQNEYYFKINLGPDLIKLCDAKGESRDTLFKLIGDDILETATERKTVRNGIVNHPIFAILFSESDFIQLMKGIHFQNTISSSAGPKQLSYKSLLFKTPNHSHAAHASPPPVAVYDPKLKLKT